MATKSDSIEEDIETTLQKSKTAIIGRIRGIDDPDLLDRYLEAEVSGQARQEIIGALNQRKDAISRCPRGCDEPIIDRFTVHDDFEIKHVNAVQYKTCIVVGEGELTVVFHDEPEEDPELQENAEPVTDTERSDTDGEMEAGQESKPETEAETEAESDPEAEDAETEPTNLPQDQRELYEKLQVNETAMTRAEIKGFMNNAVGLGPNETNKAIVGLVDRDLIEEIEPGVFKPSDK